MPGFSDVLGHEQTIAHMKSAIEANKVSHAYLLAGEKGSGKKMLAGIFARTLQCEAHGSEPCGKCHSCIQAESGNQPDIIYVTHDQTEAMTLGDRIVIMKDGFIQQIGTPQEVFDHPTNLFVAGFIGTPQMNFFDAELVKEDGRYAVVLENARVELSEAKQANLARKQVQPGPITLGVRPEHISLAGDASQAVRGTVDVAEMMGSAVHLHVDACGRDTIVILQTMDLQGAGHPIPATGSALPFTFGGNVAHVFDRETGRNLEV